MNMLLSYLRSKKISSPDPQVLRDERDRIEDAHKFVDEHPDQSVAIEVGGEKFKVTADG